MSWSDKYKKSIDCNNPKGFSQKAHCAGKKKSMNEMSNPRIPKKSGQPDKSDKHSDLYTDEDPRGTIHGLGFKDVATAKESVSKIRNSGRSHAHKIQAAIAMEQRAKVMGKNSEAAIYRKFINSMKEKTKEMSEEFKKCKSGYYYCNTNKECKPLPTGFDIPGQTIKPTEVGIGKPVEGSCNHTKKGKVCPKHGMKDCTLIGETLNSVTEEGLRDWFGKSKSDGGKPGWVQSDGSPCANEPGETKTPKCFSRSKLASMSKGEIASAVKRKREKDPGQQSKSGAASPTYVSTDSPTKKMKNEEYVNEKTMTSIEKKKKEEIVKSMKKDLAGFKNSYGDRAKDVMYATATKMAMKKKSFNENHNAIADGKEKDEEGYMANTEMDTIDSAVKKLRKIIKKGDSQLPAWVQSKITKAADYIDTAADYLDSDEMSEMSEESDKKTKGSGTKDACYTKVKSRYSVWPSAYASGALVKCRKVGAANWGNSSKNEEIVYEGDEWHPNPKIDRTLGGPGPNQRAREDYPQDPKKSKKLLPGESYIEYAKRKQRGESYVSVKSGSLSPISLKVLEDLNLDEKCWAGYKKKGMKTMFGKRYPNCVKKEDVTIEDLNGNTFAEVVDIIKPEPIKGFKSQIDESIRLQAETGNILAVILNWRGKAYSIRMFFPQIGMPSRKDVTTEIQKVYPGSQVLQYKVSTIEPGMPLIQVVNSKSKNYLTNSKKIGEEVKIDEDWQKENRKDKTDGLSQKAVNAYRRENPGSNLQTAVTEKKPTGKRASRRKNFCSRMSGMKSKLTSAETARDPDSRINKALRRWNCN